MFCCDPGDLTVGCRVAHVLSDPAGAPPYTGGGVACRSRVDVGDDDGVSGVGETVGDGQTDATTCTGHDRGGHVGTALLLNA